MSGAHQHRRPVDRVEAVDVLADDVHVGRPPLGEAVHVVREAGAGDVVHERVEPHVDAPRRWVRCPIGQNRLAAVLADRERQAPRDVLAADREVLETLAHESEHLVAPVFGLDEVRPLGEEPLEPLLVGREAEEPVLLGDPLERDGGMVRAAQRVSIADQVALVLEPLRRAVPALVRADVDVAIAIGPADHLARRLEVVGVGRADEAIGRDQELRLGFLEDCRDLVDERLRVLALLGGPVSDVERMLVGAGQESRVVALHPVPARDRIGPDDLVQRVQAGLVVGVGDGGGQVETRGRRHGRPMVAGVLPSPARDGWASGVSAARHRAVMTDDPRPVHTLTRWASDG